MFFPRSCIFVCPTYLSESASYPPRPHHPFYLYMLYLHSCKYRIPCMQQSEGSKDPKRDPGSSSYTYTRVDRYIRIYGPTKLHIRVRTYWTRTVSWRNFKSRKERGRLFPLEIWHIRVPVVQLWQLWTSLNPHAHRQTDRQTGRQRRYHSQICQLLERYQPNGSTAVQPSTPPEK